MTVGERECRLYVEADLFQDCAVRLDRAQSNHLLNVLRLRDGAGVLVFNGRHGEWRAVLAHESRRDAAVTPVEQIRPQTPHSDLHFCFAPLKHARLDYLVQKAVEMGASLLQPVLTRRTQVARVNGDRMRANAIEAAEQCGIIALPTVASEAPFERWLAGRESDRVLVFCDEKAPPGGGLAALGAVHGTGRYAVLIGPEGGFDPREREMLLAAPNVVRLSLGPRILRADTAGVAALALVQSVLGDWAHS